jgi:hypothetical protein
MRKASGFLRTMELALTEGEWDGAGLAAIHAVISATDAVLAATSRLRSADPDHAAAAALLQESLGDRAQGVVRHLKAVIAKKNVVAYEKRAITEKEASELADHARRFLAWAAGMTGGARD